MLFISNFIAFLANITHLALVLYMYVVFARAIMSWFNPNPYHPIVQWINRLTDPPLYWIRRNIPVVIAGLDLSPVLLILAIVIVDNFIIAALR